MLSAVAALVIVGLAWPVVDIELRLWRNGRIAQELIQALEVRFPGVGFRGAASYKDEVVYIMVVSHLDQSYRAQVEAWLRTAKGERSIAPQIRLRFVEDGLERDVVVD